VREFYSVHYVDLLKLKVLYNPAAGRGRARRHIDEVAAYLRGRGVEADVHASASPEDLTRVAAESSRAGYERLIVCGGDGTVNLALRDFDLERCTLAVIPLGSGDDFSRVVGIPRRVEDACDVALNGHIRVVDVASANERRFVGVAGLGFDSAVTSYANEKAPRFLRGSAVYLYSILRVLPSFTPHAIRLTVDGASRAERIMMAAVGNTRQYGGGIRIVPDAQIDDGFLDYCIVHETSRLDLLKTLPSVYTGQHVRNPVVETGRASVMRFECDQSLDVYADGERVTKTPVTFKLDDGKLRVATR
jgi:diacylglycerol kinase (ATP)